MLACVAGPPEGKSLVLACVAGPPEGKSLVLAGGERPLEEKMLRVCLRGWATEAPLGFDLVERKATLPVERLHFFNSFARPQVTLVTAGNYEDSKGPKRLVAKLHIFGVDMFYFQGRPRPHEVFLTPHKPHTS